MAVAMVTAATATATLLQLGSQPLLAPSRTNFFTGGQSVSISNARRCASFRKHPQCLTVHAKAGIERIEDSEIAVAERSVSVILLAGGKGTRMGANMPKQYLPLLGQPIALYSFYTFANMAEVSEIVVVCDPSYRDIFEEAGKDISIPLKFALPGKERQDSVRSGLQEIGKSTKLACVHDSARPLVLTKDIQQVIRDAAVHGAAVLGVPVKATIKEAGKDLFVTKTLDRRLLWEMQTPQVIEPGLLAKGFELVEREGLEVTDDVSIVEYLKHPVFITQGSYTNLKVTTPDDLLVAERILHQTAPKEVVKAVSS